MMNHTIFGKYVKKEKLNVDYTDVVLNVVKYLFESKESSYFLAIGDSFLAEGCF